MSIIVQEETKYYTEKEIITAISKFMIFEKGETRDEKTGFMVGIDDKKKIEEMFVKDFLLHLKSIEQLEKTRTIRVKYRDYTVEV